MSATLATSFAPPNALTIWTDGRALFVQLPGPGDGCTILSFTHDTLGLSKALALLGKHADFAAAPGAYTPPRGKRVGTFTQSALAEKLLRQRGLIK